MAVVRNEWTLTGKERGAKGLGSKSGNGTVFTVFTSVFPVGPHALGQ